MSMKTSLFILLIAALAVGCTHQQTVNRSFFEDPSGVSGQKTTICGEMISPNLIMSSNRQSTDIVESGINIFSRGPVEMSFKGPICVEGRVEYTGCKTGGNICTGATLDFGIWIERQVSPAKGLKLFDFGVPKP